jgi:hypothetical protein
MFNQLNSNKISDNNVANVLFEWFKVDLKITQKETSLLSPLNECLLEELDINFDFDFNYSSNPITIGQRFLYKNSVYHTESYKRIGPKRCNYAIRFKCDKINNVFYGLIQNFVCINGTFYIALKKLTIRKNICDGIKGRTSDALLLDLFYAEAKISDRIILIKYTQLVSKCIIKDLGNGNYLISEFLVDNDYN